MLVRRRKRTHLIENGDNQVSDGKLSLWLFLAKPKALGAMIFYQVFKDFCAPGESYLTLVGACAGRGWFVCHRLIPHPFLRVDAVFSVFFLFIFVPHPITSGFFVSLSLEGFNVFLHTFFFMAPGFSMLLCSCAGRRSFLRSRRNLLGGNTLRISLFLTNFN